MTDETRVSSKPETATFGGGELVFYQTGAGRYLLPAAGEVILGRDCDCDVVLADPAVSRRHCRLRSQSDGWWLEDLGSQSGTRIDDRTIDRPVHVAPGTWFQIGDSLIQLAGLEGAETAALTGSPPQDAFLLSALTAALSALASAEGLQEVLALTIEYGLQVVDCERGMIFLGRPDGPFEAVLGRDRAGLPLPVDEMLARSLPRRAFATKQPLVLADTNQVPAADLPASVLGTERRAIVCVPIPSAAGGVLCLDSSRPTASFGAGELAILSTLALHAGIALDRSELSRKTLAARQNLEDENARLRARLGNAPLGDSAAFSRALEMIRRLAPADATVCLHGETGTGKEVLARYLHRLSPRSDRPFVVIDCGALPASLIESELFGHERGAFTGAIQGRLGRLREAHGGTIFLDEIGELPLELQPRLLRFLQEHTVQPIGGRAVPVDVRVLCATHRDLEEDVRRGAFRQDLYFRLAVVTVKVPPLRERGNDVLLLAEHCLTNHGGRPAAGRLGHDLRRELLRYPWPGNVRELEHRLQRAFLLAPGAFLTAFDLGLAEANPDPTGNGDEPPAWPSLPQARLEAGERFERSYLEELLRRTKGSVKEAALLANVSRQAIHELMRRHAVDREQFR